MVIVSKNKAKFLWKNYTTHNPEAISLCEILQAPYTLNIFVYCLFDYFAKYA